MSKKKLPENEKKVKLSISIDNKINNILNLKINNKSKFIEKLILNFLNNDKNL